jgi:hypothetical protein
MAITLVNPNIPRAQWTGDGVTTRFTTGWPARAAHHIATSFLAPDAAAPVSPDIGYSVEGLDTGTVLTLVFNDPPPTGTVITAVRELPIERQEDYDQEKAFRAAAVNSEFADGIMIDQQLDMRLRRTIQLDDSDPTTGTLYLPSLAARKSKLFGFDADGLPVPVTSDGTTEAEFDVDFYAGLDAATGGMRLLFDTDDGLRKGTVDTLASYIRSSVSGLPIITREECGMAGDWDGTTGTDDSAKLQQCINTAAANGGATFMLRARAGRMFYFAGRPVGKSNVNLIFVSEIAAGERGGVGIRGTLASVVGVADARLSADIEAGVTELPLDTALLGGGVVSSFYAIGDRLLLTGQLDSAGTPLEEQEVRVTAVDADSVTIATPTLYAFKSTYAHGVYWDGWGLENQTVVRKLRTAALDSDAAEGTNTVLCDTDQIGRLAVGDWVILEDDKLQSDVVAGASDSLIHREIAQVRAIGEGSPGEVRLSRRCSRTYEIAYQARLTVMDPARGASIQGAVVNFTAAAHASAPSAVRMELAVQSTVGGCRVPNADVYGSKGNLFRAHLCWGCEFVECSAENPKYLGPGEGYGYYITHSTNTHTRACRATGCRHSYIWLCATDCDAYDPRSEDARLHDFDWHGADEVGCVAYRVEGTGSSVTASATLSCIGLGNSAGLCMPRRCGVVGGTFQDYNSDLSTCIFIEPGAIDCFVRGVTFRNIYRWLGLFDIPDHGDMIASGNAVEDCVVEGCAEWLAYMDGGFYGSISRTHAGMRVVGNRFRGISKIFNTNQLADLVITGNTFDEITEDVTYTYWLYALDITGLVVTDNQVTASSRGIRTQTCPAARIADNTFISQVNATVLNEVGVSTDLVWLDNRVIDLDNAVVSRAAGSVITEHPRLVGPQTIADDDVFVTKPLRRTGLCTVLLDDGQPFVQFAYRTGSGATAPGVLWSDSGTTFVGATGALAAAGGTDNAFNINAHTDGYLYFSNRTGGSLAIEAVWS